MAIHNGLYYLPEFRDERIPRKNSTVETYGRHALYAVNRERLGTDKEQAS